MGQQEGAREEIHSWIRHGSGRWQYWRPRRLLRRPVRSRKAAAVPGGAAIQRSFPTDAVLQLVGPRDIDEGEEEPLRRNDRHCRRVFFDYLGELATEKYRNDLPEQK